MQSIPRLVDSAALLSSSIGSAIALRDHGLKTLNPTPPPPLPSWHQHSKTQKQGSSTSERLNPKSNKAPSVVNGRRRREIRPYRRI